MFKENQQPSDNDNGIEASESSYTAPYRHRGYKKALYALRDALDNQNAVILKGVEGTGKTTLISELMSDYQHKGVPVIRFSSKLTKVSQFYSQLADCLEVPKHKKDLIRALRNTKKAGQYCLVVIDQEAIESSADIAETLKQLCLTSETTARSIKLVVVRKDYLVIHTEGTPEADFHNWIKTEVTLDPLQTDDIEGYIYYLSAIKGLQPTPYEIGTDFIMIEQSEGRISRLKALLLPLIHKDVITQRDFNKSEKGNKPLHSNHSGIIAFAFIIILAIGVGINHFIFSDTSTPKEVLAGSTKNAVPAEQTVFAESTASGNSNYTVTPPSISNIEKAEYTDLPTLDSGIAANEQTQLAEKQLKEQLEATAQITPEIKSDNDVEITTSIPAPQTQIKQASEDISALTQDEFQTEMKIRLLLLEQELTEAVVENNRLKIALLETKNEKTTAIIEKSQQQLPNPTKESSVTNDSQKILDSPVVSATEETEEKKTDLGLTLDSNKEAAIDIASSETSKPEVSVSISDAKKKPLSDLEKASNAIVRWEGAWQAQNHEVYSNSYTSNFNGAYKTHQRWLKKRYDALTSPDWIKLSRSELTNIQQSNSDIKVDFWITYEADNGYKDKTLKRLTLTEVDGEWLISKEQNLQVKPFF